MSIYDGMKEEVILGELTGDALFKAYGSVRTQSARPTRLKRRGEGQSLSAIGQEEEGSPGIVDSDWTRMRRGADRREDGHGKETSARGLHAEMVVGWWKRENGLDPSRPRDSLRLLIFHCPLHLSMREDRRLDQ
jgi:hypothetical protein